MMPQIRHWERFPYHKHYAFLCSWGVIHPRVYELSRVHGFCTSSFSFEVWLHHSTSVHVLQVSYTSNGQHLAGETVVMELVVKRPLPYQTYWKNPVYTLYLANDPLP